MRWIGWHLLTFLALFYGMGALLYVFQPAIFDPVFAPKYLCHLGLVRIHAVASVLALLLGPWQLVSSRRPHRWLGYAYAAGIVVGALTGLPMAAMARAARAHGWASP